VQENIASGTVSLSWRSRSFPECLREIPSPPKWIYYRGALSDLLERPRLAIVGSRSVTAYGRHVTEQLAGKLAEQGIVIISGLALGVDAIAHRAALDAGGLALAVLPSSVDKIYPVTNISLAEEILAKGGALVSEYGTDEYAFKQNFIARNRLVAGLAQAVLITEAAEKSGSLHTARFALEQGKDVLAVPGNITVPTSVGTNNLIKAGATPITSYSDVLHALGLRGHATSAREVRGRNRHEQIVLDLLLKGVSDGEQLLKQSGLDPSQFNQVLTMLELGGKIRPLSANQWSLH
jgi:DNA processing protein